MKANPAHYGLKLGPRPSDSELDQHLKDTLVVKVVKTLVENGLVGALLIVGAFSFFAAACWTPVESLTWPLIVVASGRDWATLVP